MATVYLVTERTDADQDDVKGVFSTDLMAPGLAQSLVSELSMNIQVCEYQIDGGPSPDRRWVTNRKAKRLEPK